MAPKTKKSKVGFNYLMEDPARPGMVKLGKAKNPLKRWRSLRTGNPGLVLTLTVPFFDYTQSETETHRHFAAVRVSGEDPEWFWASAEEARAFYERLSVAQVAVHGRSPDVRDFGQNTGLLPLPKVSGRNPALKWLLNQQCPGIPDMTIGQVVVQALSGQGNAGRWAGGLRKVGLELQSQDRAVVFDKRKGSALERFFVQGEAGRTWREQLNGFAGVNALLKSVKMDAWLKTTMSQKSIQAAVQA